MTRKVTLGQGLVGLAGMAIVRQVFSGTDEHVEARIADIRRVLDAMVRGDGIESMGIDVDEVDAHTGYAEWAPFYDGPSNPLIEIEQPLMDELLRDIVAECRANGHALGDACDAACGTGRHLRSLATAGWKVFGFDQSSSMLDIARATIPRADLRRLTFDEAPAVLGVDRFDVVTCSLALTHVDDLSRAIGSLASMVRSGGALVLTDIHPMTAFFDAQALYRNEETEQTRFVRNSVHHVSSYLSAFRTNSLVVERCEERCLRDGEGPMQQVYGVVLPDATRQAFLDMPFVLAWVLRKP